MTGFDDKRINEALDLLNQVARDKKVELQTAMEHKYTDLSSVMSAFAANMKGRAMENYDAGKQKVVDIATNIDESVHRSPWAYIGGTAAAALVCGFLLGRRQKD